MGMKSYRRIAAADLTLQIIEFMADQRGPVTGQDVAAALGQKYDTVLCHLATQQDRNFVRQVGDRFELGDRLPYCWARYRTGLQSKAERINHELKKLEVKDG